MTKDDALKVLRAMPAWADLEEIDPLNAGRIQAAVEQLATLDDRALREVVARYIAEERGAHGALSVSAASRLYVLVRFVYAAPPRAPGGLARFGAFHGIPNGEGWVDEQWPWSEQHGHMNLTSRFGGYYGDEYLALDELDAFQRRYGRRKDKR
jgi:hypothetical protein